MHRCTPSSATRRRRMMTGADGGRIVLVGPATEAWAGGGVRGRARASGGDGAREPHRTLSVEWARSGITTTTIAPVPAALRAVARDPRHVLVSHAGEPFRASHVQGALY
jgi:NAD(P)-dependent dehydrogenase (short-subunit alcohol dehydrogenase family)